MPNYNQLSIIGHVGRDPELQYSQDGAARCRFSVAVTERRGQQDETQWFNVVAFGKLAETCNQYVRKGMAILVAGPVKLNQYTGRDGQHRASLDVIARDVQFLSRVDADHEQYSDSNSAPDTEANIPW